MNIQVTSETFFPSQYLTDNVFSFYTHFFFFAKHNIKLIQNTFLNEVDDEWFKNDFLLLFQSKFTELTHTSCRMIEQDLK